MSIPTLARVRRRDSRPSPQTGAGTVGSVRPRDSARPARADRLAVFMLEQAMPGLTSTDVDAVQRTVQDSTLWLGSVGEAVHFVRGSYIPAQQRWIGLFVARGAEAIRRIAEHAELTDARISELVIVQTVRNL